MEEKTKPSPLKGVVFTWFEQGLAGVYLAFNDAQFNTPNTSTFFCEKCGIGGGKNALGRIVVAKGFALLGHTKSLCRPGKHVFKLDPPEYWSHQGLHTLKTGDRLTILSQSGKRVLWNGVVRIVNGDGRIINQWRPRGISDAKVSAWFTREHPARLIPA